MRKLRALMSRLTRAAAAAALFTLTLTACPGPGPGPDAGVNDAGSDGPPQILGVAPTEGPIAGGTTVLLTGSFFNADAQVTFGGKPGTDIDVQTSRRISVKTPPADAAGPVAVTVTNGNGQSSTLESGFIYAAGPQPSIAQAQMVGPPVLSDQTSANPVVVTISADVEVAGVTAGAGMGAGVTAQVGVAPYSPGMSLDSFAWSPAAFAQDADDPSRDRYSGTVSVPGVTGTDTTEYAVALRFSTDGATWTIADLDGATNGTSVGQLQRLQVSLNRVDYCRLGGQQMSSPPNITLKPGQLGPTLYVQLYEPGVTTGAGAGAGLEAQIGVGTATADPATWTWTNAAFNVDTGSGQDDEFQAALPNPGAGTWAFAYRARVGNGPWRYCDADGSGVGATDFEAEQAGVLTVSDATVDKCRLQFPTTLETREGVSSSKVYGWVYAAGLTDTAGQAQGIVAEVGYGPAGSQPGDPTWTWSMATYNVDQDSAQADEYEGTFLGPSAGTYSYAYRFSIGAGAKTYCDLDGSDVGGYSPAQSGALTSKAIGIDTCTLNGPATYQVVAGQTTPAITARVHSVTVTDAMGQGANITGELGYGPGGTMPAAGGWTWVGAAYAADADMGQSDEYTATLTPATFGTYRVAYRFRYQAGAYAYCDLDGSANGWAEAQAATMSVVPVCRLSLVSTPGGTMALNTIDSGDPVEATARLFISGVTSQAGAAPNVVAQVGVGTVGTDAAAGVGWGWGNATFKADDGTSGEDLWAATVNPAYTGSRAVSFRFSPDNGQTWAYCDLNGNDVGGYEIAEQSALTVNPHAEIDYCNLQFPATLTQQTGTTMPTEVYGRVYEAGVTGAMGAGPAPVAELGYGSEAEDPGVAWTWVPGAFNVFTGTNNNDTEFKATFPGSVGAGTYGYGYRFRLSSGTKWCFGDLNGSTVGGFSGGSNIGQATVTP